MWLKVKKIKSSRQNCQQNTRTIWWQRVMPLLLSFLITKYHDLKSRYQYAPWDFDIGIGNVGRLSTVLSCCIGNIGHHFGNIPSYPHYQAKISVSGDISNLLKILIFSMRVATHQHQCYPFRYISFFFNFFQEISLILSYSCP